MNRTELLNILKSHKASSEKMIEGIMEYAEFSKMENLDKIPTLVQQNPQLMQSLFEEALLYLRSKYEINSLVSPTRGEFLYF